VVISNCVINLSPDKPQVFRETYRVLRPGGRLSVTDIVTNGPLPAEILADVDAWSSCVAGALDVRDYIAAIEEAGFIDVKMAPVQFDQDVLEEVIGQPDLALEADAVHAVAVNLESGSATMIDLSEEMLESSQPPVFSAKITARKPSEAP
jgi:ubiquinone/menaquinone biosynthesis C-methylase UbiE